MATNTHVGYTNDDGRDIAQTLRGAGYSMDVADRMQRTIHSEVVDMVARERANSITARRINRAAQIVTWLSIAASTPEVLQLATSIWQHGYYKTSALLFATLAIALVFLIRWIKIGDSNEGEAPDLTVSVKDFAVAVRDLPVAKASDRLD